MPKKPWRPKWVKVTITQGLGKSEPHAEIDIFEYTKPAIALLEEELQHGNLVLDIRRQRGIRIILSAAHVAELTPLISKEFTAVCRHLFKSFATLQQRLPQLRINAATPATASQQAEQVTTFEWPVGYEHQLTSLLTRLVRKKRRATNTGSE